MHPISNIAGVCGEGSQGLEDIRRYTAYNLWFDQANCVYPLLVQNLENFEALIF